MALESHSERISQEPFYLLLYDLFLFTLTVVHLRINAKKLLDVSICPCLRRFFKLEAHRASLFICSYNVVVTLL